MILFVNNNKVVWSDTPDGTHSRSHAPTTFDHTPNWDGEHNIQTTLEFIQYEATNADWAKITAFDGDPCVSLSLGWGNPHSAMNLEDEEGDGNNF